MLTPPHVVERLTKLDVAKRELREAIWLLFHERDAIAVHTLAAAAHQILDDLAERRGLERLRNSPHIRQEKKARWKQAINAPQNFFKHADQDPDASFHFNVELPHFFIADAIQMYTQLTQDQSFREGILYLIWFSVKYPDVMEENAFKSVLLPDIRPGFDPENFQQMRLLLARLSST